MTKSKTIVTGTKAQTKPTSKSATGSKTTATGIKEQAKSKTTTRAKVQTKPKSVSKEVKPEVKSKPQKVMVSKPESTEIKSEPKQKSQVSEALESKLKPREMSKPEPKIKKDEVDSMWQHLKPRILELIKETSGTKIKALKTESKPEPKLQKITPLTLENENEEIDYKKVNAFINTQSKMNQWFMRPIVYSGERTEIEFEKIPVIREWESGKSTKAIAFTRMEDKLGLAQLQEDGVVGLHVSQPVNDDYVHLENTELAEKIEEALIKAKFTKKEVIKVFGGGTGFRGESIIKLLSDEYTIQCIENKQMKRKWLVEITEDNENDEKNRSLKFTPMGQ